MKNKHFKISIIAFCTLLMFLFLQNERKIYAQKMPTFTKAAVRNNILQNDLQWSFGGKGQRGWLLYVPLMRQTLQIESDADSPEFAKAVSIWQKNAGIKIDGIINKETLFSFIKYWQSRRIKPIVLADDNQLLNAPISNFYDSTRNVELLKVEKETFAAYKKMIAAAVADKNLGLKVDEKGNLSEEESFLKLVSTYRSPAYQAGLRKKEPNASSAQIAFVSPHFTGRALDIYVGGEPVTTKDFNRAVQIETPVYKWLVKNAGRFGFYPYFYEPWHWEYVPENAKAQ